MTAYLIITQISELDSIILLGYGKKTWYIGLQRISEFLHIILVLFRHFAMQVENIYESWELEYRPHPEKWLT